ncbi:MAG: hypothetical protein EPO06_12065 [Burkholderiaceae bacterium]|nr:MAG: hypothetical protein EPO06_12065 [Burkholderiaceae bacterium]
MAETLDTKITVSVTATVTDERDLGKTTGANKLSESFHFGNSTSDDTFGEQRELTRDNSYTYNLTDGSLKDPAGRDLDFSDVTSMTVKNHDNSVNSLVVGGGEGDWDSWAFDGTSGILLRPGAAVCLVAAQGWNVNNSGTLRMYATDDNDGVTTYDIVLTGQED